VQHSREGPELALVLAAFDVFVEALVVVGRELQADRDVFLRIEFVNAPVATGFATKLFRQRFASDWKPARTAKPRRVRRPEESGRVLTTVLWSNMHIERSLQ